MFIRIADLSDSRLEIYRDLPSARVAKRAPYFIAESRLVVRRLIQSDYQIDSILCSEAAHHELDDLVSARPETPIFVLPIEQLNELIGFHLHRGMLAAARRPANPTLELLLRRAGSGAATIVVCPQVTDPTNLAAIIRNCAAFGVNALIVGAKSTDVYSRRVVRVSMGNLFQLPIRISQNLTDDLEQLKHRFGFERVATVLSDGATPLMNAARPQRLVLIFGSEGPGLDEVTIRASDQQVTLPMQAGTDSLNLATSAAVFLYHYHMISKSDTDRVIQN